MNILKKIIIVLGAIIIIAAAIKILSNNNNINKKNIQSGNPEHQEHPAENSKTGQVWTCSMHPQIKRAAPGKCPICGMDLILAQSDGSEVKLNQISLSESAVKLAEIMTDTVKRRNIDYEIRLTGKINYNETLFKVISAWIGGRLDKLYINFTGATVKRGEPLALIYSPDLYAAQIEFLESLKLKLKQKKNDAQTSNKTTNALNLDLAEAARQKLKLLGLDENMISEMEKKGEAETNFKVTAPVSGVVIKRNATEGMYVDAGMPLYEIADLSELWALCDIYEADLSYVKTGQRIQFTAEAYPGEKFIGHISFIDPVIDPMTRTAKIRVDIDNSAGKLKPEMFVRAIVKINGNMDKPLVIPASAPLITGKRSIVYVEIANTNKPTYEGREVILGRKSNDYYTVISGLKEGEKVVTNGNFKIDSAMQIQAKPSMMNPDGGIKTPDHSAHTGLQDNRQAAGSHSNHRAEQTGKFVLTVEKQKEINSIFKMYFKLQEQLAADDFKQSIITAGKLTSGINSIIKSNSEFYSNFTQLFNELHQTAKGLSSTENITDLRAGFKNLSQIFIKLEKQTGYYNFADYYKVYCPMAFDGAGAEWLQNNKNVKNPYLGKSMDTCGEIKNR